LWGKMGSGRQPGVWVDACLLLLHRSGGVVFGLSLVFVWWIWVDEKGDGGRCVSGARLGKLSFV